jgi:hypothetical protein
MNETIALRKIAPSTTKQTDTTQYAAQFETSYRSAYVPEQGSVLRGDRYPRVPRARSDISSVMGISGTTMADAKPTQRDSYRPPAAGASERLGKIQQPKSKEFRPVALQPAQTKCV